jgi:hypothetical protein
MSDAKATEKRPPIALTNGSKIRIHSAGPRDEAMISTGTFRGLVSIGGDNSLAIELEAEGHEKPGPIRLVPLNALLAIDILEAAKPEEEKRSETPSAAPGYFR